MDNDNSGKKEKGAMRASVSTTVLPGPSIRRAVDVARLAEIHDLIEGVE